MTTTIIYAISFLLSFVNFMIFYSYPFRLYEFSVAEGIAGVVVGAATVLTLIMRILSGYIMDRFNIRWGLFITSAIYLVALYLVNGNSEGSVIVGRLLLGMMLGIMSTLLMYYSIITSADASAKAKNVSLITFFNVLPTCLAPFVALKMTEMLGVNSVTTIAAALFIFCVIFCFILDIKVKKHISPEAKGAQDAHDSFSEGIAGVSRNHKVVAAIIILAFIYIISGTTVTFLPGYLIQAGNPHAAWYFLTFSVCMMLPRLLLKKYMPHDERFPYTLILICIVLSLIGNVANYTLAGSLLVIIGAICNGVTLGIIYPAIMSFVVCSVGNYLSGTLSSLVAAAADLGVIASNLLLGLFTLYFSFHMAMLIPVAASLISLGVLLLLFFSTVITRKGSLL